MAQHLHGEPIVIGLVNNMPDGALKTTERQFKELLAAAGTGIGVRLRVFSLPNVPRGEAIRAYIDENYEDISKLWQGGVDGLIVSGTEPRAPNLSEEPYWPNLTELIDWAQANTRSSIWSCLAAHAAVYYLDGVKRQGFAQKLSGVFECAKVADHAILAATPQSWSIPHSRSNDLPESALVARGYQILTRSPQAGADMFVKDGRSLFLYLQGHPEYDPQALLLEYRRDIGRYLRGERDQYPLMPQGYFGAQIATQLAALQRRALTQRRIELLEEFPAVDMTTDSQHSWRAAAVRIYTNWLAEIAARKRQARAR